MADCVRFCQLRQREVIHVSEGLRMGYPKDIVLDLCCSQAAALVVPGPCKLKNLFGKREEYVIPWSCIRRIGDDLILVEGPSIAWRKACVKKSWLHG